MDVTLPPLRDVIRSYGLSARKSLGQHFLLDTNITDKIVCVSGNVKGLNIIEIGAGPGGLTRSLLKNEAKCIYAVEKDERCIKALGDLKKVYNERLIVIPEDALKLLPTEAISAPRAIIANLPYNIGTALLVKWLDDIARDSKAYAFLTLMFQKEVAIRLLAEPGSKQYGRLSVMMQWLCDAKHCFDLPASAFVPPPKVASTVVKLSPLAKPRFPADKCTLEKILAAAFGQRRKMLRSSLASVCDDTEDWLRRADINPTRRAETLSIEEFCRLAMINQY